MDVTSATRLFSRYWLVLAIAIAVPVTTVSAYVAHSPHTYTARTRLLAAPTVPQAQAQADAVVSQVQAVATSRDLVATALATVGVHRDPAAVVRSIAVSGVGSSGLVDLSYSDTSATVAQQVDTAVANIVVTRLLALRAGVPELVQNFGDLIASLQAERAAAAATAHPSARTQAVVAGLDTLIGNMTADQTRLVNFGQTGSSVAIVDTATLPPMDGSGLVAKLAVAALLGLVIGLLIVGTYETVRPRVSGAGPVARLLDAPVVGHVGSELAAMTDLGRRLRLAGRRKLITSIVLIRADGGPVAPELASRLRIVTLDPLPAPRQPAFAPTVPDGASDTSASDTSGADNGDGTNGPVDDAIAAAEVSAMSTILTLTAPLPRQPAEVRLRHVICLEDLDTEAEAERIGVVVIAGRTTRVRAIANVRDLVETTGWSMLGVLGDPRNRSGM